MSEDLQRIYSNRFSREAGEVESKNKLWQVLCRQFFQRWIEPGSVVLDLGAGYCEFINNIQARKKIAVDLNPDTEKYAGKGVIFHRSPVTDLRFIEDGSVDVVFVSNLFEHMRTKDDIVQSLLECRRVLRQKTTRGGGAES